MCLHEHGFTDLSLSLRGFLHDCTLGSHLLAQNLSKSLNLDFRHEQMSSSVFSFFGYLFILFFALFWCGFFWHGFVCLFGVFWGGVALVFLKREV